jgi:hypothetical protein
MIESLLNRNVTADRKFGIQLFFATESLKHFDKLTRLTIPDRPDELMLGNEELRDFIRRVSRSNRVSPADVAKGALFGSWREAIFRIEGLNAGRVESLIHIARTLQHVPDHAADFRAVIEFTGITWGFIMPPIPEPIEARRFASRITRQMDALPMILRDVDHYEPSARSEPERGGDPKRITQTTLSYFDGEEDDDALEEAPF